MSRLMRKLLVLFLGVAVGTSAVAAGPSSGKAEDYLTKDGKLRERIEVHELQGGFAGFTGKFWAIEADGAWSHGSLAVRAEPKKGKPDTQGRLNVTQLAQLAAELARHDLATLPNHGEVQVNPRKLAITFGKKSVTLLPKPGPDAAQDKAIRARYAGIAAAVKGLARFTEVNLYSNVCTPSVPLAESPQGVVRFTLKVAVDEKGEGTGQLILDPNRRTFNEFGDETSVTEIAHKTLACTIKYVKSRKLPEPPNPEHEEHLYAIQGPSLTSKLFLATFTKELQSARLLIHAREGGVAYVVEMHAPGKPIPCHPGCFPASTQVITPNGSRAIENIRAGEIVTTVRPDGQTASLKVQSVFVTTNRLLKVDTDAGILVTTLTQPLCLEDAEFRAAGELQAGDRIYRWQNGSRQAVTVRSVTLTDREAQVFNLILGDCEVFIAGGFLARSKPPVAAVLSAEPRLPTLALPGSRE